MTTVILIRHGETDYNLQKRYCGFSNPPLNKRGIRQAEMLSLRLKDTKIDKIYSSNLNRAFQTAKIIAGDNSIKKVPDFREMNFGIFEGLRYEEIIKKYPLIYNDWINNQTDVQVPDGERLKGLVQRVRKGLSGILSQDAGNVIGIVTHSGPIRVILCDALRYDFNKFWQIEQEIGALNIIDYSNELAPVVVKINDISHLI